MSSTDRDKLMKTGPALIQGPPITEMHSVFTAIIASTTAEDEVHTASRKLVSMPGVFGAAHNVAAFRLRNPKTAATQESWQDDGDYGVGRHLIRLLTRRNLTNLTVFVTRQYGSAHLRYKRWAAIERALDSALQKAKL